MAYERSESSRDLIRTPAKLDQLIWELRSEQDGLQQEKAEVEEELEQEKDPDTRKLLTQRILSTNQLILATMQQLTLLYQTHYCTPPPEAATKEDLKEMKDDQPDNADKEARG
uniref:Uncharacterized protein n=1 Tax=Vitrella brassicaformis TaxID=1169539 RepID=A0A7S1P873_9ALVE|mmetsp:Transcript_37187/g.93349  ORF Transcript_37187/g.93349 Transcript_37187/m.93349 type:complete len:113 (+) Transcript_37187:243-581(+)